MANPPRSVFVDLPLGHTVGLPFDTEGQRRILTEGLEAGVAMTEAGSFCDLGIRYVDDDWKADPLAWSRKKQNAGGTRPGSPRSGDTRTGRSDRPVYQSPEDEAAAAAVTWDEQCLVCVGLPEPE